MLLLLLLFTLFNRLNESLLVTLSIDSQLTSVYCHMGDFGCGDGGWTPIMKIDGNKVRGNYHFLDLKYYQTDKSICKLKRNYALMLFLLHSLRRLFTYFSMFSSLRVILRPWRIVKSKFICHLIWGKTFFIHMIFLILVKCNIPYGNRYSYIRFMISVRSFVTYR